MNFTRSLIILITIDILYKVIQKNHKDSIIYTLLITIMENMVYIQENLILFIYPHSRLLQYYKKIRKVLYFMLIISWPLSINAIQLLIKHDNNIEHLVIEMMLLHVLFIYVSYRH